MRRMRREILRHGLLRDGREPSNLTIAYSDTSSTLVSKASLRTFMNQKPYIFFLFQTSLSLATVLYGAPVHAGGPGMLYVYQSSASVSTYNPCLLTVRFATSGEYISILISGSVSDQQPPPIVNISKLTSHTPHSRNFRHILLPRKLLPTPTNIQMRTLRIELRLIRTMQTDNLMPDNIPPRPQVLRNRLGPQTRTAIPHTKRLLEPRSFFDGTFQ